MQVEESQPFPKSLQAGQTAPVCLQLGPRGPLLLEPAWPKRRPQRPAEEPGVGRRAAEPSTPRRADGSEPQTAKINKEAGDKVRVRPVPKMAAPPPLSATGEQERSQPALCTQPLTEQKRQGKD